MNKDVARFSIVVSSFRQLESQLAEFISYVPFIDSNRSIISPRLIPLISESCSLIESIFKECFIDSDKSSRMNMKKYATIIEPLLELSETSTIFLSNPIQFLNPFKDWEKQKLSWWNSYNQLKHNRISKYEVATLDNAVLALAGLHQVVSRTREFIPFLLADSWFNNSSGDVYELICARIAQAGVPIQTIPVETDFFITALNGNIVCVDGKNQWPVDDTECQFSDRAKVILTTHEYLLTR